MFGADPSANAHITGRKHRSVVMIQSSTMSVALKFERKGQSDVEQFRSVVKTLRSERALQRALSCCPLDVTSRYSDLFDVMGDDEIATIIYFLVRLTGESTNTLDLVEQVGRSRCNTINFALTCRRIASVLRNIATNTQVELLARASTKITPLCMDIEYPFTKQMCDEMRSCDQFRMLRAAQNNIACHCSKPCCKRYQKALNKDIRKGSVFKTLVLPMLASRMVPKHPTKSRLIPLLESCSLLATNASGNSIFAHVRKRLSKRNVHGEARGRRFEETLVKLEMKQCDDGAIDSVLYHMTAEVELNLHDFSTPLTMRVANDGSACVYISSTHPPADEEQESAFSSAFVWTPQFPTTQLLQLPSQLPECSTFFFSAQDAWFVDNATDMPSVVVAWSTDFVHPSGHVVGSNATPFGDIHDAAFFLVTYTLKENVWEPDGVGHLHEYKQLLTCSPTRGGDTVLTLTKQRMKFYAMIFNVSNDCYSELRLDSVCIKIWSPFVSPFVRGSVAASISPSGDCVATINHTSDGKGCHSSTVVEILVRTTHGFSSIQSIDISTWIDLMTDNDSMALPYGVVKAKFGVSFSACGRWVSVLDRHPMFGESPNKHGCVLIDTALRMDTLKALRPFPLFPLFPTDDQAPRSLHWTESGIVLEPPGTDELGAIGSRGGALILYCPNAASHFDVKT